MTSSKERQLLFSSDPHSDESFMGYLLRLAALNHFDTPSWMLQKAHIKSYVRSSLSFAFDSSLNLTSLIRLTGVNASDLKLLPYSAVNTSKKSIGDYLVFGSPVPQYMIRLRYPKICPACLRDSGYARKTWELSPVTVCHIHRCLLLDECPNCNKRMSWCRHRLNCCSCEFDWVEYESPVIKDSEINVTQRIHQLCSRPILLLEGDKLVEANPLYGLHLKQFLSALFFIASQFAGVVDTKGKHLAPSMRNADLHVLLCKAWCVFENWPNNYFDFLNWRRKQVTASTSAYGLRRDFAEYKSALYKQLAMPELEFMRAAFHEYLIKHWDGGYAAHVKRLNGASLHDGKYMSRREAKVSLRVSVQSIDKFITIGRLKAIIRKQGDTRLILIERASLLGFKLKLDQSLYLKQVQGLLGFSHKRVMELVACKLLNPLRGPLTDGCSDWKFSAEEIDNLLNRIKKKIKPQASLTLDSTMSLLMTLRKLNRMNIKMGEFIRDILEGEIVPCGEGDKTGLTSFLFPKSQVVNYLSSKCESRATK